MVVVLIITKDKDNNETYQCGNCKSVLLGDDEFDRCPVCGFTNVPEDNISIIPEGGLTIVEVPKKFRLR